MQRKRYKSSEVAAILRQEILNGRLPADSAVSTVRELSDRYGISTVTADRALRQLVEEDYVYRVERRGTFVKNSPPKIPRIGVITVHPRHSVTGIPDLPNWDRCAPYLQKLGYTPELIGYRELIEPELGLRKLHCLDGLIINAGTVDAKSLKVLNEFSGQLVLYGYDYPCLELLANQVFPDFKVAFREVLRTIRPDNYPEIIFLKSTHSNADHIAGQWIKMLKNTGYPEKSIRKLEVPPIPGDNGPLVAYQACSKHIGEFKGKLVISVSDYLSFGLVNALRDHHLEPGRDLDLISTDNVEEEYGILPFGEPFLTSVSRNRERVQREAVELMLELLQKNDDRRHIIQLPTSLVIRRSTGLFTLIEYTTTGDKK